MAESPENKTGSIYYRYCGPKNNMDAVWCQSCGKTLAREQGSNNESIASQPEPQTIPFKSVPSLRSNRTRNIIVGVAVGLLVLVMVIALMSFGTKTQITGVNLQIQYGTYDQGYFGPVSQTLTLSNQPNGILEMNPGQQFWYAFTLTESALATSGDSITDIAVTTPGFTIISIEPTTPIDFSAGSTKEITITFQSPQTSFHDAINLVITTSGGEAPTNQVQIQVQYSGAWSGAYGDTGGIQSWNGAGDYTITLDRPNGTAMWIVTANAQKQDSSSNLLTISIVKMDGTVLKTSSTSTVYGLAQVSVNVP